MRSKTADAVFEQRLKRHARRQASVPFLLGQSFESADATQHIGAVLASPYFHGATRLGNRLRKREWSLSVCGARCATPTV
ncbi:hypothetical protein BN2475_40041 [Paraburkholderia ribeironis]|uniref:Uncharacterized protein n=1 Tax=Paraburkholderia ribeironis TaxID=1247936 RepID=A0A1N7RJA5_9BURK|nr:hypothetical protein BN2475_40041 [Paraburkholderia ribeironis]